MDKYLRRPRVEDRTGLKRSTIYSLMKNGKFPRSVKITGKAVAWRESDIKEWMDSRPLTRSARAK